VAFLIALCTIVLAGLVVLVVSGPLRHAPDGLDASGPASAGPGDDAGAELARVSRRDQLEAAREAKYREIRDAEMDYRTGKLSESDYRTTDAQLKAEALVILDELERNPAG
jgi:hypothetical protein